MFRGYCGRKSELPCKRRAGVLACEFTRRPAGCWCWRRDAAATRSRDGCATHSWGLQGTSKARKAGIRLANDVISRLEPDLRRQVRTLFEHSSWRQILR